MRTAERGCRFKEKRRAQEGGRGQAWAGFSLVASFREAVECVLLAKKGSVSAGRPGSDSSSGVGLTRSEELVWWGHAVWQR